MKPIEVFRSYADAWNSRDVNTLVAAFTKDGIYCNPYTHPGIGGEALAEYMKAVWTAFPDFRVEVLNAGEIGPGLVAHHWMIKGTNTGQGVDGSAPTGRTVSLKELPSFRLRATRLRQIIPTLIEPLLTNSLSRNLAHDGPQDFPSGELHCAAILARCRQVHS
jgi:hypothetical protein